MPVSIENLFPQNFKLQPGCVLQVALAERIGHFPNHVVIATAGSQYDAKSGLGFSVHIDWSCLFKLHDYTPLLEHELLPMALAIKKVPSSASNVILITESLSLCTSFDKCEICIHLTTFRHFFQITYYLCALCGSLGIRVSSSMRPGIH